MQIKNKKNLKRIVCVVLQSPCTENVRAFIMLKLDTVFGRK